MQLNNFFKHSLNVVTLSLGFFLTGNVLAMEVEKDESTQTKRPLTPRPSRKSGGIGRGRGRRLVEKWKQKKGSVNSSPSNLYDQETPLPTFPFDPPSFEDQELDKEKEKKEGESKEGSKQKPQILVESLSSDEEKKVSKEPKTNSSSKDPLKKEKDPLKEKKDSSDSSSEEDEEKLLDKDPKKKGESQRPGFFTTRKKLFVAGTFVGIAAIIAYKYLQNSEKETDKEIYV